MWEILCLEIVQQKVAKLEKGRKEEGQRKEKRKERKAHPMGPKGAAPLSLSS